MDSRFIINLQNATLDIVEPIAPSTKAEYTPQVGMNDCQKAKPGKPFMTRRSVVKPDRPGNVSDTRARWSAMMRRWVLSACGAIALFWGGTAQAGNSPWSMTLYAGPSSTAFVTQILGGK